MGLHVVVPLEPHYDYEIAKGFAELVARRIHAVLPKDTTLERTIARRPEDLVYLDWVQVGKGKPTSRRSPCGLGTGRRCRCRWHGGRSRRCAASAPPRPPPRCGAGRSRTCPSSSRKPATRGGTRGGSPNRSKALYHALARSGEFKTSHGSTRDLVRRDQLRTRHDPGQALHGRSHERPALQLPAQEGRGPHLQRAALHASATRRSSTPISCAATSTRRASTSPSPTTTSRRSARGDAVGPDRRVRRARPDQPDVLRHAVLSRAREEGPPRLRAAARRADRLEQGRDRAGRDPLARAHRRGQAQRRSAGARADALRRRAGRPERASTSRRSTRKSPTRRRRSPRCSSTR